jgi:hypothetical protein
MDSRKLWIRLGLGLGLGASLGVSSVLGTACQNDESTRSSACKLFCQRLETCDDSTDLSGCTIACKEQTYRSDVYFEMRAECASLSCNHWASQVTSDGEDDCSGTCALPDCIDDKLDSVELSRTEQQLCDAVKNKLLGCDTSLDPDAVADQCRNVVLSSSGDFATKSRDCVDKPCVEIDRCLDKLSDQYNTDLRIFSGPLSP